MATFLVLFTKTLFLMREKVHIFFEQKNTSSQPCCPLHHSHRIGSYTMWTSHKKNKKLRNGPIGPRILKRKYSNTHKRIMIWRFYWGSPPRKDLSRMKSGVTVCDFLKHCLKKKEKLFSKTHQKTNMEVRKPSWIYIPWILVDWRPSIFLILCKNPSFYIHPFLHGFSCGWKKTIDLSFNQIMVIYKIKIKYQL